MRLFVLGVCFASLLATPAFARASSHQTTVAVYAYGANDRPTQDQMKVVLAETGRIEAACIASVKSVLGTAPKFSASGALDLHQRLDARQAYVRCLEYVVHQESEKGAFGPGVLVSTINPYGGNE